MEQQTPFDHITRGQLQNLWDAGFTVIPRNIFGSDVYGIADRICRPGMAQQWGNKDDFIGFVGEGWVPVPADRYPGLFAPYPVTGNPTTSHIEIGNLVLFEKPKHQVEKKLQEASAKALQQVDDWYEKQKMAGLSGAIRSQAQSNEGNSLVTAIEIGESKSIENMAQIPRFMIANIGRILNERDRLATEHVRKVESGFESEFDAAFHAAMTLNPDAPKWPTLHAIVLPKAIENIRAKLKAEGAEHGTPTNSD